MNSAALFLELKEKIITSRKWCLLGTKLDHFNAVNIQFNGQNSKAGKQDTSKIYCRPQEFIAPESFFANGPN